MVSVSRLFLWRERHGIGYDENGLDPFCFLVWIIICFIFTILTKLSRHFIWSLDMQLEYATNTFIGEQIDG
jgi:hypothetical protein